MIASLGNCKSIGVSGASDWLQSVGGQGEQVMGDGARKKLTPVADNIS